MRGVTAIHRALASPPQREPAGDAAPALAIPFVAAPAIPSTDDIRMGHDPMEDARLPHSTLRRKLRNAHIESVMALVAAVEAKDPHTERHSVGVATYAEELARAAGLSAKDVESIVIAGLLHDVGKIAVPDAILAKPGALTESEFNVIRLHPERGVAILRPIESLGRELPLVLHHHEWFNGRGYPRGLRGREVPFGARILQVADSIDAMLSPRSYKKARSVKETICELHRCRGTQFDPCLADLAIGMLQDRRVNGVRHGSSTTGWPRSLTAAYWPVMTPA
ncbi:MAG: hypothetical protein DCC65_13710 [Planctomycetota bacterium]|nr:MAG: hypothetical protein DCC65_13710 [Planctomycetota bacterium]